MIYNYTMENYSAVKSKLIGTGIWMNLKNIISMERNQTHTQTHRHKNYTLTIGFYLQKAEEQAKLLCHSRSKNNGFQSRVERKGHKRPFRVMKALLMVIHIYKTVKINQNERLRSVNFIEYKCYSNSNRNHKMWTKFLLK